VILARLEVFTISGLFTLARAQDADGGENLSLDLLLRKLGCYRLSCDRFIFDKIYPIVLKYKIFSGSWDSSSKITEVFTNGQKIFSPDDTLLTAF
jgi:hypothetical protein